MSVSDASNKQTITDADNVEINVLNPNTVDLDAGKSISTAIHLKYFSLIIYTFQNVIRATLIRYASTRPGPRYIKSTFVVVCEIQKAVFSILLVFIEQRSIIVGLKAILQAFIKEPFTTIKISMIASIYIIQNNLCLFAISKLDIATFSVTMQLRILTAAFFTKILLKRNFTGTQWFSLILLFFGISLVEIENLTSKNVEKDVEPVAGIIAIIILSLCSGFTGVYGEKIIRNTEISIWIYNIQLAIFGIISGSLGMFIFDGNTVKTQGIFYGYTKLVWISINIDSIGGLIVALVLKYSDNILKGFASATSVIFSCIIAKIYFNFQLTILFSIGSSLVIFSIIMYSNPTLNLSKIIFK